MRKLMMTAVAIGGLAAGPAVAADMPVKALPPPPPVFTWTGPYAGLQAGGGWAHTNYASDFNCAVGVLCESADQNSSGWVLGGQLGYRYQFNRVVLGIEGSFAAADINSTVGSTCTPGVNTCIGIPGGFDVRYKTTVDSLASATLQAGWAFENNFLVYAKGGWATAQISRQANDVLGPAAAATFESVLHNHASGYTVGVGGEYAFSNTVSFALEYDYYRLNAGARSTIAVSGSGVNAFLNTEGPLSANVHTVMLRMNLRFPDLIFH
jgi:outer membrane immunogenic protein